MRDEYVRRATVVRWVDADTVVLEVDLGFRVYRTMTVRLAGVDAPELRRGTPEERARGRSARDFAVDRWEPGSRVVLSSGGEKSFDRWVGSVYVGSESVGDVLVRAGHAVYS